MTADATPMELPAWRWDSKAGVLRPSCPICSERLMLSGTRLTCLIVGHAHYHQPVDAVIAAVLERLAGPIPS